MNLLDVSFVIFIMLRAISAQFLEQPGPGALLVPVQDQVTLTCSVEEGYIIDWRIDLVDGSTEEVYASDGIVREDLLQRGFTLEGVTSNESTLSLRNTDNQTNNGTNITCVARRTGALAVPFPGENTVTVIFYGAPPPPTDLSVTEDELGSLNISWSLGFIEGVPVNYTLTVFNLNTTSSESITEVLNQYFIFSTDRPCDVYSFTVIAVTAAGNSSPSQELIFARCLSTTITDQKRSAATSLNQLTFTPVWKDNTTSPTIQDNSTVILITIVSTVMIMVIAVLVVVNVIVCACCHKKKKQVTSNDIVEPVYETPGDAVHAKDVNQPFAMTTSFAYDVSKNFMTLAQKISPRHYPPL